MPICLIQTNLSAGSLPDNLHTQFSKCVSEVLGKPEERISVTVNSGLQMCRGGSSEPTILVKIWSIGVFGKEKNAEHGRQLAEFFKSHFPTIPGNRIVLLFLPIEPHDVFIAA